MKVAKIQIQNILGIENLEILPGKVTKIEGRNGSGKTSALEAIKAALKGGHDATLLRKGSEVGEIVLVLENGTRIIKTVTATESNTKVTNENGKMSKPMQFIGQLSDEISLNPIKFLECKPADRADFLLEAMPLEANVTEIGEIISPALQGQKVDIPKGHALKCVDGVYDQLFQHRQDINRTLKEKVATIDQLSISIPKDMPADPQAELDKIQKDIDALKEDGNARAQEIQSADRKAKEEIKVRASEQLQAIRDKTEAELKVLHDATEEKRVKLMDEVSPAIKDLGDKLAAGKQIAQEAVRVLNTKKILDGMNAEAGKLKDKSNAHTTALEALKEYKNGLLKNLPIDVEIKDGKVFRGGIPYETLNLAQQTQIAVDLAKIRAKELGLICLDGAESLDSATLAALEDAIAKTDLQAVMTFVKDTDLTVTEK